MSIFAKYVGGQSQSGGGGGGTVTSVGLTVPSIFTVSGSPVTTTGTLALALAPESANTVFAGPASGSAAQPTFRMLVASDIPSLNYIPTAGTTTVNDIATFNNTTGSSLQDSGLQVIPYDSTNIGPDLIPANNGYNLNILTQPSAAAGTGAGNYVQVLPGANTLGQGGGIYLVTGKGLGGGEIEIETGASTSGNNSGGPITISAGASTGTAVGASVSVTAGAAVSGAGGNLSLSSGSSSSAASGNVNLTAGNGNNSSQSGSINITSGSNSGSGYSGNIIFAAGSASAGISKSGGFLFNLNSSGGGTYGELDGTVGAWTFGKSGGTQYHTINGSLLITQNVDISTPQTVLEGSSSGTVTFSQPFNGPSFKKVLIYCSSFSGTALVNFPIPFIFTPVIVSTSGPSASVVTSLSTTSATLTGSSTTGFIILEGW